jgi:GNAT superfamily N-acetyltransferase
MPVPIDIRELTEADFDRFHEVDVSEHITLVYRLVNGLLVPEAHDWQRPAWDQTHWHRRVAEWRTDLVPDVWLGGFMDGRLVGLASMRHRLARSLAQLTTLHVDYRFRRRGVAARLLEAVVAAAQAGGAESLYVSATRSESAVGFYLSQGFLPANRPDPGMLQREPEDIHMVVRLNAPRPV